MSRHRAVKNLDLDDELDDGGFDSSEDYYEDMTSEQQAQMVAATTQVKQVLGQQDSISDKQIRDSLWDSYFDVEGTISYLLDELHKQESKKKRKEEQGKENSQTSPQLEDSQQGETRVKMERLSLQPTPSNTTSLPPPAKPSKLSTKIALAKSTPTSSSTPKDPPTSSSNGDVAPPPTKPLSKLQQKMLLAKQQKSQSSSQSSSNPFSTPTPSEATPPPPTPIDDTIMVTLPASFEPSPFLVARPSPFASALKPHLKQELKAGKELAEHLAKSSPIELAMGGKRERWGLSPDDKVLEARKGTALGKETAKTTSKPSSKPTPSSSSTASPKISLKKPTSSSTTILSSGTPTQQLPQQPRISQLQNDMESLGLSSSHSLKQVEAEEKERRKEEERLVREKEESVEQEGLGQGKEKILEEVRKREGEKGEKPTISLVVVGHVDAGKSTLMGRVLHELGETEDRVMEGYQRASTKMGKGSFAYAWTFDALEEERERGVTIEIAIDSFQTATKRFTLIDAPGHRDFIPNMISGAAQADTAVLVVDGSSGAFEKGFEGGGQTREHAVLVRSLGVRQVVVAVNKLDAVDWSQKRFEAIRETLLPFLTTQTGFDKNKVSFVPVGAMSGENLVERNNEILKSWYEGKTLIETLDALEVPSRSLEAPLRIPVSNVFKGQSATASGLAVSGRIESGLVQVGEQLAALPGDETGVVRAIEVDSELVPYALAGSNVTLFLSGIDALQLSIGTVLCPPSQPIPVVSTFTAQIIVFEPKYPITAGYAVELFHHSKDIPASISKLDAILDKTSGEVTKLKPRLLTKGCSAKVTIQLRPSAGIRSSAIPIEPFSVNKNMGRVLFRRGGETVAAGIVLECM